MILRTEHSADDISKEKPAYEKKKVCNFYERDLKRNFKCYTITFPFVFENSQ
jgi:hypothetical protein